MKATLYHNPNCSKSRAAKQLLEAEPGVELTVIEYLKHPPSAEKLAALYQRAGISPQQGLRLAGTDAKERGLDDPALAPEKVIAAMAAEPKLIERPLIETEKGVRIGRPTEVIREIL